MLNLKISIYVSMLAGVVGMGLSGLGGQPSNFKEFGTGSPGLEIAVETAPLLSPEVIQSTGAEAALQDCPLKIVFCSDNGSYTACAPSSMGVPCTTASPCPPMRSTLCDIVSSRFGCSTSGTGVSCDTFASCVQYKAAPCEYYGPCIGPQVACLPFPAGPNCSFASTCGVPPPTP